MFGVLELQLTRMGPSSEPLPRIASSKMNVVHNVINSVPQPVQQAVKDAIDQLQPTMQPAVKAIQQHIDAVNTVLQPLTPVQLVALTLVVNVISLGLISLIVSVKERILEAGGLVPSLFGVLRNLPFVSSYIRREKSKIKLKLLNGRSIPANPITQLPKHGMSSQEVLQELEHRKSADVKNKEGDSKLSGCIYMGTTSHKQLMDEVFNSFSITNPLHADQFPSVGRMEAEVVSMAAAMLGGGPGTDVCGAMTSGGSESILLAMKASRDWARARRGVRDPEIIIASSAHAAYIKAAEYFRMRLIVLPVGKDLRLSAKAVRAALTRNTAVVVASAPCYPHGVVDDVAGIAKVCKRAGVCLHVDACLGGFVLPFAAKLGRPIPAFDFRVKGVTSMSVDTHKFALAHKGSSVVLYAHPDIRAHQFTCVTDWSGGLYISPSMAGSRPGGLIATAWASLIALGEQGLLDQARQLMQLSDRFQAGLKSIPELTVLGRPDMCLVAFAANTTTAPGLNIYKVKDVMSRKGWYLSALQKPPGLHFCFTPAHIGGQQDVVQCLLEDLKQAVQEVMSASKTTSSSKDEGGSAPLYGMANVIPDRRMVADFLVVYQDVMLTA